MHDTTRQTDTASSSDVDERARAAVKAFRAMQPGLSAYARAITKNSKVRVEVASGPPRTDGTTIFYRPPIGLGDPTRHDRFICSKRDPETNLQTCPACKIREEVLVNIYHEIAHIAFGTFIETSDRAKRDAIDAAVREWGGKYEIKIRTKITQAPASMKSTYLGLAGLISPFLPHLYNAMEDARIETAMFDARRGTRKMLQADVLNLLKVGIPSPTGSDDRKQYADLELNAQIALVIYQQAVGYVGWEEYFSPKVVEDSRDAQIQTLIEKLRKAQNAADVYYTTFPMLARLRELGYFQLPEDEPQPQPGDEGGPDEDGESSSESQDENSNGSSSESDPSGERGDSNEGSAADSEFDDSQPEEGSGSEDGQSSSDAGESDSDGSDRESTASGESSADERSDSRADSGPRGTGDNEDSAELSDQEESSSSSGEDSGEDSQEGELDADSDEVPSESDGSEDASDGGSSEESDGEGGGEAGSTGEAGKGADSSPDSNNEDAGNRGNQASGGVDYSADGEHSEQRNDSEGEEVTDQHDDDLSQERSGDESGEVSGDGAAGESMGPGDVDQGASSDEESESEGSRDRPEREHQDDNDELLDSGADEGLGGVGVNEIEEDLPEYGTPEDLKDIFEQIHPHLEPGDQIDIHGDGLEKKSIDTAVEQGNYFEWPSKGVESIVEHWRKPGDAYGWAEAEDFNNAGLTTSELKRYGIICDTDIPESVLGLITLKARRIFDANKTATYQNNLRSGRINSKVLGRRAWKKDDDRLFGKKRLPGKKDYAVVIEMDISSSNLGSNLALLKRSVFAQAELLDRVGVPFCIVAHSCEGVGLRRNGYTLHLHHVKEWNEPWDSERRARVADLVGIGGNLDGHAMEYGRKMLGKIEATDKILLYYTDGKFPAANKEEELEVLLHQLQLCQRDRITLLGVGIRTDSPVRFGLDTVQVDTDDDLQRVVEHLGKRLLRSAR